eukprot:jgi/Tetstr1/447172/TSEL_034609.t1
MSVLDECDRILGNDVPSDSTHEERLIERARSKVAVLSHLAKRTCELATEETDPDPVRTLLLVSSVNTLLGGIDTVHKLLRQAVPAADDAYKGMAEIRKGPYRNLSRDVETQIAYSDRVGWAVVPALQCAVNVLRELEEIAQ